MESVLQNIVILINCGGAMDIVEELQPEADVVFFVVDSHRPTDVCNIYSQSQVICAQLLSEFFFTIFVLALQVRLLRKVEDDENIPEFDQIFRNDEVTYHFF